MGKGRATSETVDSIVDEVRKELSTRAGKARVARVLDWAQAVVDNADRLTEWKGSLRARSGTQFFFDPKAASRQPLKLSVRTHGVRCGDVVIQDDGPRFLAPSSPATALAALARPKGRVRWSSKEGRDYIGRAVAAASTAYGHREAAVEAAALQAMEWKGKGPKAMFRGYQPVLLGGLPLQIPVPVVPRGKSSKTLGHIDILARTKGGGLAVFELKAPKASTTDLVGALPQAVRYAAALQVMMEDVDAKALLLRAVGIGGNRRPKMRAIALVPGESEKKLSFVEENQEELLVSNRAGLNVAVMSYRWEQKKRQLVLS